ncbi:MAG TPA: hypothetical protein VFN68_14980 [Acidimicrobiales bacterium]|nr:hypothetical protein [Acidimicrobiales bacterium]
MAGGSPEPQRPDRPGAPEDAQRDPLEAAPQVPPGILLGPPSGSRRPREANGAVTPGGARRPGPVLAAPAA